VHDPTRSSDAPPRGVGAGSAVSVDVSNSASRLRALRASARLLSCMGIAHSSERLTLQERAAGLTWSNPQRSGWMLLRFRYKLSGWEAFTLQPDCARVRAQQSWTSASQRPAHCEPDPDSAKSSGHQEVQFDCRRRHTWFMSMDCRASLWQKMMAWFWFSGLPSPSTTPRLLSGLPGSRTLRIGHEC